MNYREVNEQFSFDDLRIDPSLNLTEAYGQCSINGYIAIPVYHLSPRYQTNETFTIKLSHHHNHDCVLITCKGMPFTYGAASATSVAAFLRDANTEDIYNSHYTDYAFKHDYVVVRDSSYALYHSLYKETSSIWGAFSHQRNLPQHEKLTNAFTVEAYSDLCIPTEDHKLSTLRTIHESTALGHYLSLYHLIELSFDLDLLQDLVALGTDLRGFGKLIATYNNAELQKLIRIVKKYWSEEASLEHHLRDFFSHSPFDNTIDEMLYDYDKDGFPWSFKDQPAKRVQFAAHVKHSFTKASVDGAKFGWTLENLQRAVAYIIYRFRCAIAHASIGEHILTIQDSALITTKATPLLMGLISQMYKKTP
ncbi:hypothetical protein LOY34_18250 [Pseudomonas sp. B21-009]|uniref:hypothetical protein n=1 Tax=Pseudomonas sp. B21-009 TaxID=2895470 RepID=UPI00215E9171|nr:hypothetical protein [Pseudomonas sp. B21-009]UVM65266.1 hypothetical protein LOY34_18250 [Pseudomonas sp. B21-009]